MPYPGKGPLDAQELVTQRKWVTKYGGFAAGRSNCDYFTHGEPTSLNYQDEDLSSAADGNVLSFEMIVPQLSEVDLTGVTHFPVPMLQFLGRHPLGQP